MALRARGKQDLAAALAELDGLDLAGLRARWTAIDGGSAPPSFRDGLLRAALAYKLQEQALGGLRPATRTLLRRLAVKADPGLRESAKLDDSGDEAGGGDLAVTLQVRAQRAARATPVRIKPGTRLLRTWQGSTHEVIVAEAGVLYRGEAFRSLSEVARLITGQRWSGPLFFGLKQRRGTGAEP